MHVCDNYLDLWYLLLSILILMNIINFIILFLLFIKVIKYEKLIQDEVLSKDTIKFYKKLIMECSTNFINKNIFENKINFIQQIENYIRSKVHDPE
jgi:hypothetical protein